MDRRRNRWVLRLAIVLVAGGVMLYWALKQQAERVLTIVNKSGQTVVEMTVAAGDEQHTYRDLADGKDVIVPFVTNSDVRVTINLHLQDGTRRRRRGRPRSVSSCTSPPLASKRRPAAVVDPRHTFCS